ncbi:MAG: glycosyltransferase family 1 protein [Prevotellaceae bacterium]|jgi:glycosyltransferase involved in cell wall biosynthesis|nr:glycosyltransferase family 1 protein [Prevotellaceae bacterium]
MKILLLGEFSHLHATLAQGLRELGHEVCVAASDNGWKRYRYDISLNRPTNSLRDGVRCLCRVLRHLPDFRGFDVVQLISPYFLRLRSERTLPVYRYLKRHNGKVFLGAFGTDYYYIRACMEGDTFRYSDFKTGDTYRDTPFNRATLADWYRGGAARATRTIAESCDGIIACLWEYYVSYLPFFPEKTTFIPLPIDHRGITTRVRDIPEVMNLFIGIQTARSVLKGTDRMLPVLHEIHRRYPDRCRITCVEDVPYLRYEQLMDDADVQLDQLYSYTPSMNALLALAKGITVVGGGEPEPYALLHEPELRPVVNVVPDEQDIYNKVENLVTHPERIPELSRQGIAYIARHHDCIDVARQYVEAWNAARTPSNFHAHRDKFPCASR